MYRRLLFVSSKKYKLSDVEDIIKTYCFDYKIPEMLLGEIDCEAVKKIFEDAKPSNYHIYVAKKEFDETKDEKWKRKLEEYDALLSGNIIKFFNMIDGFSVRDNKVYTTKNIVNGKFYAAFFDNALTKKNGNFCNCCRRDELAEYMSDSITMFIDYDKGTSFTVTSPLVLRDNEKYVEEEAIARAEAVMESKKNMSGMISAIEDKRYCYGLYY